MQLINISHKDAVRRATEAIHASPVLVQLPNVFVLLAAPTQRGAQGLDSLKIRQGGKNYGTAIGSLSRFIGQADKASLPDGFSTAADFRKLQGAFIRLPFREKGFESCTIRHGTHQGLLLGGRYNKLFRAIETSFEGHAAEAMWDGRNYNAPLCTSCNISGDPEGSIVAYDKALQFGRDRGVELFITNRKPAAELGSYPIFGFEQEKVSIHRDGPGLAMFKERIPAGLRNW